MFRSLILAVFALTQVNYYPNATHSHPALGPVGGGSIRYYPSVGYDWYVDSVAGLDSNDGTTPLSALQTITALEAKTLEAGDRVGLARGSHWREELNVAVNNVVIEAYGTGAAPVLDASDVVSSGAWSKTGGRTNVYEATLTHEATGGGDGPIVRVWEDGVRLSRAADLGACDATPGTYYPSTETSPYTLYIHATGSGDPATNGKAYEVPVRKWGLYSWLAESIVVSGVTTQRNMHNNGSLVIGKFGTANGVTAKEGTKHNIFFREGGRGSGIAAEEEYNAGETASMLIVFDDTQAATDGREDIILSGIECSVSSNPDAFCFYTHTSGFTATWDVTTYGMRVTGLGANGSAANTSGVVRHYNPTVSNSGALGPAFYCGGGSDFYLINATIADTIGNAALLFTSSSPCRVSGGTFGPAGGAMLYIAYASVADTQVYVDGATFVGDSGDYVALGFNIGGNPAALSVTNSTFSTTQAGNSAVYRLAAGYPFTGDYNNYSGFAYVGLVGPDLKALAAWQADTGQDAHSVGP